MLARGFRRNVTRRRLAPALLVCLAGGLVLSGALGARRPPGAADGRAVVSLEVQGRRHPVHGFREEKTLFLDLTDVARAVGGSWGRDPLTRKPLFTLDRHRVRFSPGARRVSVDGRRRRLSSAPVFRRGTFYVPADFIDTVLAGIATSPVVLRDQPPPAEPPETAEPLQAPARPGPFDTEPGLRRDKKAVRGLQVIVLDPGHGGEEEGARGPTGLLEKDVVLDMARRLSRRLRRWGYEVYLTRTGDEDVPLEQRTAMANNKKADLFVSLHANASPSPTARGAETYYLSLDRAAEAGAERFGPGEREALVGADDPQAPLQLILWDMAQSASLAESSRVAAIIQARFNEVLDIPDRGVKQAPLRVLVGATMPAVLVEIGFISNPDEEEDLRDPLFLERMVDSLAEAIDTYRVDLRGRGGP
ncbi:MAG: N-acetylmuramoyl-L-alanine amidase [Acidobacteriota bacterium]